MSNSMLSAISAYSIGARALMSEHTNNQLVWCFVEGITDAAVYNKFVNNQSVGVLNTGSKDRVIDALSYYLNFKKEKFAIGIVDADQDHALAKTHDIKELFLTDTTDLIVLAFESASLKFSFDRCECMQSIEQARKDIYESARFLGQLRLINAKYDIGIKFSATHEIIASPTDEALDKLIVRNPHIKVSKEDLERRLKSLDHHPDAQLCQGHDVIHATLYFLQKSTAKGWQGPLKLEECLLTAYDSHDFKATKLYADICQWAKIREIDFFRV